MFSGKHNAYTYKSHKINVLIEELRFSLVLFLTMCTCVFICWYVHVNAGVLGSKEKGIRSPGAGGDKWL